MLTSQPHVPESQAPLLSICIPTCNRAGFLQVMLQALLPQVQDLSDQVEVWVLDNASTDQTPQVLAESAALGPFRVHRQNQNVGPTRNIVCGPARLADGLFTWVLGDHNLIRPNSLATVVKTLTDHFETDTFYVNYRAADYPEHWPTAALAGHEGQFTYVGNPEVNAGMLKEWCELLTPHSAACTQNYVHIIRTQLWRDYWLDRKVGEDYSDAESTYPHTVTVAALCCRRPCFVVSDCMFTIFNGAQSWQDPRNRVRVYCNGLPDLLKLFRKLGVPSTRLNELKRQFAVPVTEGIFREIFQRNGLVTTTLIVQQECLHFSYATFCFCSIFLKTAFPWTHLICRNLREWVRSHRSWYIYNNRPARYLRTLLRRYINR